MAVMVREAELLPSASPSASAAPSSSSSTETSLLQSLSPSISQTSHLALSTSKNAPKSVLACLCPWLSLRPLLVHPRKLPNMFGPGAANSTPAAFASSSGIRLLVAISTPPRWKNEVRNVFRSFDAARSGIWNSSRKRIGDVETVSFASERTECSVSMPRR